MAKSYARDQIKRLREDTDLREIAARFTPLKGNGEQYGPCPQCGGVDRFHVQREMFFCRQCRPIEAGKRHDVFDFVLWMGLAHTFQEAVEFVKSTCLRVVPEPVPVRQFEQATPVSWLYQARRFVEAAQIRLYTHEGEAVHEYLSNRNLSDASWRVHHLGAASFNGQDVVVIPWYAGGRITAVQMRFIEGRNGARYRRWGYQGFYGHLSLYKTMRKHSDTLVICEGELNSLAIWQATKYNAVSIGSQNFTPKTEDQIRIVSNCYRHIWIWCDEEDTAQRIGALVGPRARLAESGLDANARLCLGTLLEAFPAR